MSRLFKTEMRLSLRSVLFILSITGVVLYLAVISILLYYSTKSSIKENFNLIDTTKFNQIASDLDLFFGRSLKVVDHLANNKSLITQLHTMQQPGTLPAEKNKISAEITRTLVHLQSYSEYINAINIITDNVQYHSGDYLYFYDELKHKQYNVSEDENAIQFYYPLQLFESFPKKDPNSLLKNLNQSMYFYTELIDHHTKYGNIIVFLNTVKLTEMIPELDNIMIINRSGETLFQGKNLDSSVNLGSSQDQIFRKQLKFHDWTLVYKVDAFIYQKQLDLIRQLAYFSLAISLMLTFVFSGYLSRQILLPASKLISLIRRHKVGDSNLTESFQTDGKLRITLREKVFYYFVLTVLIPVCCFVVIFYTQYAKVIQQNMIDSYHLVFQKTASDINNYMSEKEKLLVGISYSTAIQKVLVSNDLVNNENAYDLIEQFIYLGLQEDPFHLFDLTGQLMISSGFRAEREMNDPEYYSQLQQSSRQFLWSVGKDRNNNDTLKLGTGVIDMLKSNRAGFADIEMNYELFAKSFSNLGGEDAETFIFGLQPKNESVLAAGSNEMREQLIGLSGVRNIDVDGERRMLFYERLGSRNLYLVSLLNSNIVYKTGFTTLLNNIYSLIILLLILLILSYYVSWKVLKPLNRINKLLDYPATVQFEELSKEYYYINEIHELGGKFQLMIERTEDLIDELLLTKMKKHEIEMEKKTAEIHALQAQINPHFLQNTLDNTVYMIKNDHKEQAVQMIISLSSLFRFGISRGENIIDIQEELKYVKAYVNIINIRHNHMIRFIWQIDDALLTYKTLKLTLQPMIENAIHHGIFDKSEGAMIIVACKDAGEHIQFKVTDNGKGIPEVELAELIRRINEKQAGESIGLYNVQSRIRLFFSEKYGLTIESEVGQGTTVTLTIPKITRGESGRHRDEEELLL